MFQHTLADQLKPGDDQSAGVTRLQLMSGAGWARHQRLIDPGIVIGCPKGDTNSRENRMNRTYLLNQCVPSRLSGLLFFLPRSPLLEKPLSQGEPTQLVKIIYTARPYFLALQYIMQLVLVT